MREAVAAWVLVCVLAGCGSSDAVLDSGQADGEVQLDANAADMGLCGGAVCGANAMCVGTGDSAECECEAAAAQCGDTCVAATLDQAPIPNPVAGWPEEPSRGCVGQPVEVGRSGRLTAVRVVMPMGVPFTMDVGVLSEEDAGLGTGPSIVNSFTCAPAMFYWTTWATGAGTGQGALCSAFMPCPAPTSEHYTTIALDGGLEVQQGDVLYFIFRFDTQGYSFPMAFQTHYAQESFRTGQNLDSQILAIETLVAACE